jgi:hypothetical protein
MLEHYKKRFVGMQIFIAIFVLGIYLVDGHQWIPAAVFFVVMQFSAFVGAAWATRLKRRMQQGRGW